MADQPSIEAQIDLFLEQFKISASKVMEEGTAHIINRSSYLDSETSQPGSQINMDEVDSAEKEASEVLHSLLSVERVEKLVKHEGNEFVSPDSGHEVQWSSTPVLFTNEQYQTIEDHQVIWESQIEDDNQGSQLVSIYTDSPSTSTHALKAEDTIEQNEDVHEIVEHGIQDEEDEELEIVDLRKFKPKAPIRRPKVRAPFKKTKKKKTPPENDIKNHIDESNDPTKLETSADQVKLRFKKGCECQDERCFMGLNPETVYKHRLNIAELTKGEHDMYLMGVTMACLANPDTTVRQKERRRQRAQYVYQGRRVCLDAFLYLENCTHYQLKRIRKHVMTHGVAPRVHGNHGKKPHNTFSLDIYRHATDFLNDYMVQRTGMETVWSSKQPVQLPWDITRKDLHEAYKEYGQAIDPGVKLMGYSSFRHFMKEQFPHVKFCKIEAKPVTSSTVPQPIAPQTQAPSQNNSTQVRPVTTSTLSTSQLQAIPAFKQVVQAQATQQVPVSVVAEAMDSQNIQIQKCVINNEVQQVIPLMMASSDGQSTQPQTFIVTPVQQLVNGGIQGTSTQNSFSYQLGSGFVINEQGNIISTMTANAQQTPFAFSRI